MLTSNSLRLITGETKFMHKKYFLNIDFLRFIFSIIIVYFHIFSQKFITSISEFGILNKYHTLQHNCNDAYLIVECFFIIAGFFLFKNFIEKKELTFTQFTINKIARLFPVLFFSILLAAIFFKLNLFTAIINSLFLQCIGVTLAYKGICWYISPLFWVMIFYFYLLKNFDQKYTNLIIAFCIYISLVVNINTFNGGLGGRYTVHVLFNAGLLRALQGIGIGYFLGMFYHKIKDKVSYSLNTLSDKFLFLVFSILEFTIFGFFIRYFIFKKTHYDNKLIFIIAFSVLLLSFVLKRGLLAKILENKYLAYCGKYAYSIYVMQQISFNILSKTIWKYTYSNIPLCITVTLLFTTILGILTYYLIEIPFGKLLKNKLSQLLT
jgi:peptidoglycan/LPS O-acetylase OafA/YrhL